MHIADIVEAHVKSGGGQAWYRRNAQDPSKLDVILSQAAGTGPKPVGEVDESLLPQLLKAGAVEWPTPS